MKWLEHGSRASMGLVDPVTYGWVWWITRSQWEGKPSPALAILFLSLACLVQLGFHFVPSFLTRRVSCHLTIQEEIHSFDLNFKEGTGENLFFFF